MEQGMNHNCITIGSNGSQQDEPGKKASLPSLINA
jgi:hypothetical protein